MRRPNNKLEKKYISSLVIAAFLALSLLTANSIRMGNTRKTESDTETKETLSPSGSGESDGRANGYSGGYGRDENSSRSGSAPYDSRSEEEASRDNETKETERKSKRNEDETDTEQNNSSKREDEENDASAQMNREYHYDGKTKLTWPVLGNIILPYSMDTTVYYTTLDQYACNDGVLISASPGEKVRSAASGRIVNIADTDRYGLTVTMMIGDYYELIYGQLDEVRYEIGDEIKEGQVIGTVAEPTRSFLLEGPNLYFKMTHRGKTVNPTDYLK